MKIGFADHYLSKYRCNYFIEPEIFLPFDLIIVIPCYNEPEICKTLQSVFNCHHDGLTIGVVVVINHPVNAPFDVISQNRKTHIELSLLSAKQGEGLHLFVISVEDFPEKHGGVGWARKIGMDWAIAQFNHFGHNGIIVSLDADTLVDTTYLHVIDSYFKLNPEKVGATIYFEHSLSYDTVNDKKFEKAIVLYELYMRYYRNALLNTGFPASLYTVGSCFAVKAEAYIAQGGMNRKKAGEDFYFLHKLAMYGEVGEINSTAIFPSSRISDRVPFGTGPVIRKYLEGDKSLELTYPLSSFLVVKHFFERAHYFYQSGNGLRDDDLSSDKTFLQFAKENNIISKLMSLSANCSTCDVYCKRFFHVINAFMVLKWLNFSVEKNFPRADLFGECVKLLQIMGITENQIPVDANLMLNLFRQIDKERTNH